MVRRIEEGEAIPQLEVESEFDRLASRYSVSMLAIRSMKRAEAILDVLLAPYVQAALVEDRQEQPPNPADWRVNLVASSNPEVLVGNAEERDAIELEHELGLVADKEYRRSKVTKRRPPCHELPTLQDARGDSLDWARFCFVLSYRVRLSQANARVWGNESHWRKYAQLRGLDASADATEPLHDSACELLADLWARVFAQSFLSDLSIVVGAIRMQAPTTREPVEPVSIPENLAAFLSPVESRVLAAWTAQPRDKPSIREVARTSGVWRENIPSVLEGIKLNALPWALALVRE